MLHSLFILIFSFLLFCCWALFTIFPLFHYFVTISFLYLCSSILRFICNTQKQIEKKGTRTHRTLYWIQKAYKMTVEIVIFFFSIFLLFRLPFSLNRKKKKILITILSSNVANAKKKVKGRRRWRIKGGLCICLRTCL